MKRNYIVCSALIFTALTTGAQAQTQERKFIDKANMDTLTKPSDNFYEYANGGWLKNNPIPSTETRWGTFNQLIRNTNDVLKKLLEEAAAKNAAYGSNSQLAGDFYASGMDTLEIESLGISPISNELATITAISSQKDLVSAITAFHKSGYAPGYNFVIYQDDKNSSQVISQLSQGGLGLPDREYYFNTDERSVKIRAEYVKHLVNMFKILGDDNKTANKNADAVMRLETALAEVSMTKVEQRDPNKIYRKMTVKDLNALTPMTDWKEILKDYTGKDITEVLVRQPNFLKELDKQFIATPLNEWKAYLRWNIIRTAAPYLSNKAVVENFNFYGKVLTGQKVLKPRENRVAIEIDQNLGEVLGRIYVNNHFRPEAKARMIELINNLSTTYEERIKRLDWMSDATKEKALIKLHAIIRKIGYPDKWRDYSQVHISRTAYYGNVVECRKFDFQTMIDKLGKPVDKTEWLMTTPTINAYYNPTVNEIVFPAGILQFPFFDFNADDAVNYGGIGAAIGHEMTHGFDDEGRQYDAEGNLKDWWTNDDAERFKAHAFRVEEQYSAYTVLNGTMHVNGKLTLGENLADLGGLNIAYEAFKKTPQGKNNELIDGFTPDQRFFLSWAQVWRANIRDEAQAQRIVTDPHSPGKYRCNGPVSNMPEFYKAFNVKEGDPMWRATGDRAKVW
ncbi:M13 family metallopeptidase [Solitalea canadensis]|uniref:Putative metalloendopeptidase n=1 Tax=Solitalea canadensis (strain ATCC 29591 / DSM 3403 / JCM 21819 / LMG 8368 / NBRC 15130 / NCIMB 12057 / USAM 9D) TaxID=929556 RepID=H8KTI7_SOLCM|nr:M13 family metallopeptidase [Solitalea canadensis]AFD06445.1 putative metalloendopeptidase [Solitalea canadensis DSM 3403]